MPTDRRTFGVDRLVWTDAARKDEGVPWYTEVPLEAERLMASWHKSQEEDRRLREVNRAAKALLANQKTKTKRQRQRQRQKKDKGKTKERQRQRQRKDKDKRKTKTKTKEREERQRKNKEKTGNAEEEGGGERGKGREREREDVKEALVVFIIKRVSNLLFVFVRFFFSLLFPNFLFSQFFVFPIFCFAPPGASLLMNESDLTTCLELNLLLFLSRIFSVIASGAIRVARPSKNLGVRGVFAWLVRNPTKCSPAQ